MKKILPLIISMAVTLVAGGWSAWLIKDSVGIYELLEKPFGAPPGIVFPIIWTALYILMSISAYEIYKTGSAGKDTLLELYVIQLVVNCIWPLIFFNWQLFLASVIWLALLWGIVLLTIFLFYRCSKRSAYLLIPYFIWVTFAGYLNFFIYRMN